MEHLRSAERTPEKDQGLLSTNLAQSARRPSKLSTSVWPGLIKRRAREKWSAKKCDIANTCPWERLKKAVCHSEAIMWNKLLLLLLLSVLWQTKLASSLVNFRAHYKIFWLFLTYCQYFSGKDPTPEQKFCIHAATYLNSEHTSSWCKYTQILPNLSLIADSICCQSAL